MRVRLGPMPDHRKMRVYNGLHCLKVGPSGPKELDQIYWFSNLDNIGRNNHSLKNYHLTKKWCAVFIFKVIMGYYWKTILKISEFYLMKIIIKYKNGLK